MSKAAKVLDYIKTKRLHKDKEKVTTGSGSQAITDV